MKQQQNQKIFTKNSQIEKSPENTAKEIVIKNVQVAYTSNIKKKSKKSKI